MSKLLPNTAPIHDPTNAFASLGLVAPWRCSLDLLASPLPDLAWLVDQVLPCEGIVLLSGREGALKTWIAIEWARHVAEGQAWLGRECEGGAVLYLDAEMPEALFRHRLNAVGGSRNLNIWRWQDGNFPSRLDDYRLLEAAKSHRLIVVDTLRRFMEGRDENSSTEMATITSKLRSLTQWGATILVLHHATKDPERFAYRGSTELGAGVDVVLTAIKQQKGEIGSLTLSVSKTRYSVQASITLGVEKSPDRPIFSDTTNPADDRNLDCSEESLHALEEVIRQLRTQDGKPPNQTEIVTEARKQELGSRNTILQLLRRGKGSRWRSWPDGRSVLYWVAPSSPICPPVPTPSGMDKLDSSNQPPHMVIDDVD